MYILIMTVFFDIHSLDVYKVDSQIYQEKFTNIGACLRKMSEFQAAFNANYKAGENEMLTRCVKENK